LKGDIDMANYMAEVAKMLGVELDEEFDVCFDNSNVYMKAKLTENGFKVNDTNMVALVPHSSIQVFEWLLCGLATIKHKPYRPEREYFYWNVQPDGEYALIRWLDTATDYNNYKLGNCYRTKEDARKDYCKWKLFYASDEVLEV
jgi:hypothetical protein